MAITTYTSLKAATAAWLARDGDTDITDRFDDLLALCEQRMYFGKVAMPSLMLPAMEAIRIAEMENVDSAFALSATVAKPTGFLELIEVSLPSPGGTINIVEQSILDNYATTTSDAMLALSGTNFRFKGPATATTATLRYYKRLTTPSASASNWIIENAPGVYLNGCLLEAAIFTQDLEAAKIYAAMYAADAAGLNENRNRQLFSARNLKMRIRGRTP